MIAASAALFGRGDLAGIDEATLAAALTETGLHDVPAGATIVELLVATNLATSNSEARRTIADGGANLNNRRISDPDFAATDGDLLHGGTWWCAAVGGPWPVPA